MTKEELEAKIAEIIIPSGKPKSTGNSHRRKEIENRKLRKNINYILRESKILIHDCNKWYSHPGSLEFNGVCYNAETGRFIKSSHAIHYSDKTIRRYEKKWSIRTIRKYKGDISNGSKYKRIGNRFIVW